MSRWKMIQAMFFLIGLMMPLGTLEVASAQQESLRREAFCTLQFSQSLRSGDCLVEVRDQTLIATLQAREEEDFFEGAAGSAIRRRRNADQPSQDVRVEIPVNDIFSLNYQLWNEVGGGFLIPRSLISVDYSMIEIGFITTPTAERSNFTNLLKIATNVEFGSQMKARLTTTLANPTEVVTQDGISSHTTAASASAPTTQIQQLLETNACVRCDLRGANLEAADLDKANLEGANLAGANLAKAELKRAYLIGANLEGAILIAADLKGASLVHANLTTADLKKANLMGANLTHASLESTNLTQATLAAPTLMANANLQGANLSSASLMGVDLSGANLAGANLTDANLRDFTFSVTPNIFSSSREGQPTGGEVMVALLLGTDQNKTFRFKTNLDGANLSGANLSNANLKDATVAGSNLNQANLVGANLEDVDLTTSSLCQAILPDGSRSEQGC